MVLQGIETPRKVNDVGAGVVSGALLLGQGLAALLTSKPARIGLQPFDGSKGSSVDISVEAAKDLALLSRDTAVVLAEGGALFGIVDLQGAAKPRPIARDVRALYARAGGEMALAIGDDGKGMALTQGRSEVGVRAFPLKGALYACDIGDQATYVIVDGEGGRVLRVHPGATPELGASARVALPEGAQSLDRLRGGPALCVAYKRGDDRVCVVQGSTKLEAKMVSLEAKVADAAVLDGSLLVAFIDGRLALYDRDAIEGAGDAPLTATALTPLGAQGRPRVLLAGTSKASTALWIGTTAGEVLRIAMTRQQEAVSQPRAPQAPPKAVETQPAVEAPPARDYAAELATRERELEELRAEMTQMKAAHEAQIKAHEAQTEAQTKAHEAQTEAQIKAHEAQTEARTKAHEAQTEAQTKAHEAQTKAYEAQTKAYEQMRSEVDHLMADLTRERERIEKVFPFGSEGLRSVERAREKLSAVIAQIQSVIPK
jgi:hypothetical protein